VHIHLVDAFDFCPNLSLSVTQQLLSPSSWGTAPLKEVSFDSVNLVMSLENHKTMGHSVPFD